MHFTTQLTRMIYQTKKNSDTEDSGDKDDDTEPEKYTDAENKRWIFMVAKRILIDAPSVEL